jgi:hypothetical protein
VAGFDLVATAAFATPATAALFVRAIYAMDQLLGGTAAVPAFSSLQWLMATLAGSLGVLWAVVRLMSPSVFLAQADSVARCWVAGLILYYVLAGDAPHVLLAFVVTELGGAALQLGLLTRPSARGH